MQACLRLQRGGVAFELQRRFHIPRLTKKFVPLTAEAMVARLLQEPADFRHHFNANTPSAMHQPIRGLGDLAQLDALYGIGDAASLHRPTAMKALRSLEALGWRFTTQEIDDGIARVESGALAALTVADRAHANPWGAPPLTVATPPAAPATDKDVLIYPWSDDQIAAVDYFLGSGRDHGLRRPALALRLRELGARGCVFSFPNYHNRAFNGDTTLQGLLSGLPLGVSLQCYPVYVDGIPNIMIPDM